MYVTSRKMDASMADAVGKFMDANFYSILGEKWERVSNPLLQKRGVDVLFGDCKIDEKVKIKGGFANKILQYPSFELSFVNKFGKRQSGWFMDSGNITDYYSLIAVFGNFEDENGLKYEKIDHLNALFVKKSDLLSYVDEIGIDLNEDVNSLSSGFAGERLDHGGGIHVKMSEQFSEKPINMVVRRDVICDFKHTREFFVYKGYIQDYKNSY